MKYLAYWIGFLFLLTGCYPDMKPQLEEAEALLTENPDSAYRLLQAIERPERRQEAEYATWCLLMTQATDYGRTTRLAPVRRCAITYMLVISPTASVSAMP